MTLYMFLLSALAGFIGTGAALILKSIFLSITKKTNLAKIVDLGAR